MSEDGLSIQVSGEDAASQTVGGPEVTLGTVDLQAQANGETGRISVTAGEQPAAATTDVPAWVPEKFRGAEDPYKALADSYKALEAKQGGQTTEPDATPEVPDAPLSIQNYQDKWALQGGKLEDTQWQSLSDQMGVSLADLKAYEASVLSQKGAETNTHDSAIYEAAGGQAKYDALVDWAGTNYDDAQLDRLNAMLDSPALSAEGVKELQAAYTAKMGSEPQVSTLQKTGNTEILGGDELMTESEVQFAQSDPRYGVDPKYTKDFEQKVMRYMKRTGMM